MKFKIETVGIGRIINLGVFGGVQVSIEACIWGREGANGNPMGGVISSHGLTC